MSCSNYGRHPKLAISKSYDAYGHFTQVLMLVFIFVFNGMGVGIFTHHDVKEKKDI